MAEKELPNLRATENILVGGKHIAIGQVIPKSAFAVKGDWQNLTLSFDPPRMVETDDPVGLPKAEKAAKAAAMPGA